MQAPTRFQLIFGALVGAILLVGMLVLLPGMKQLRAIDTCLDAGNTWDYSTRTCVAPINPHPTVSDTAAVKVKPRIVPKH